MDEENDSNIINTSSFLASYLFFAVVIYSAIKLYFGATTVFFFFEDAIFLGAVVFISAKYLSERLMKQKKEIKIIKEEKEFLVDILRHDLLNPAVQIISYADIFADENDDFEKIKTLAGKEKELIDKASKYARIQKKDTLKLDDSIELDEILEEKVEELKERNPEKMTVTVEKEEIDANVSPDIDLLFDCMLSTSIERSEEGEEVSCTLKEKDGTWEFSVEDNGPNIPKENMENLFDLYQSASSNRLDLGLARLISEKHSGKINVEDSPGRGLVFRAEIPKEPES